MNDFTSNPDPTVLVGLIFGVLLIPILVILLVRAIGKYKIYEKAGKPGWAAFIPIYSTIVTLEIVGKPLWWIFLILFPCTSFIFSIWTANLLSKSFGQQEGFTVGLVLLPVIFYPILGFGDYKYMGPSASEARGFNNHNGDQFNPPPPPQV